MMSMLSATMAMVPDSWLSGVRLMLSLCRTASSSERTLKKNGPIFKSASCGSKPRSANGRVPERLGRPSLNSPLIYSECASGPTGGGATVRLGNCEFRKRVCGAMPTRSGWNAPAGILVRPSVPVYPALLPAVWSRTGGGWLLRNCGCCAHSTAGKIASKKMATRTPAIGRRKMARSLTGQWSEPGPLVGGDVKPCGLRRGRRSSPFSRRDPCGSSSKKLAEDPPAARKMADRPAARAAGLPR